MEKLIQAIAAVLLFLPAINLTAQTYPSRPVKIVVPFGVGSASDIVTRLVATNMTETMGQPFIVENRLGASGTLGTEFAFRASPDGYTLALSSAAMAITASAYPNLKYETAAFKQITVMTKSPLALATNPSTPMTSIAQFIEFARANPNKVNFGSLGVATSHHLTGEKLKMDAGIQMVHVPYKGSSAAHSDLIGGHIQVMFDNIAALMPYFKSGKLRPLAVSSSKRHRLLPEVPTLMEAGVKDFEAVAWTGIAAPPGTPDEIINTLNTGFLKVLSRPEVHQRLIDGGFDVIGNSPADADHFLKSEIARWKSVIKAANVRLSD